MKGILEILLFSALMILGWSCMSENHAPENNDLEINFIASFMDEEPIKTRYDSIYIDVSQYDQNFYILLSTEVNGEAILKGGTYAIPSGFEGRLSSIDDEPLNWQDLNSEHTFYGWTVPWDDELYSSGVNDNDIEITFSDSSESNYDEIENNSIYDTFVGAKSAGYSYDEHGKYVNLTFFHLVSKIHIGTFQLTEASGAIQRNLKAEITFINMPTSGTFHPFPDNGSRPYIEPAPADGNDGITYYISNQPSVDHSDYFYICPETDFSTVDFQIKLKSSEYADYDTYYGTFDAVEFVRNTPVEDFDSPEGNDQKVLHAGEIMTININLIPGVGPGLKLVIDKWNTEEPTESQYHTYPGLYSQAEVQQLLDYCNDQKSPDDTSALERLFESFGVEEDGNKYFPLYENIDISSQSKGNYFPLWKDYILDGQGHTLTMKTNSNNWFNGTPYFNIGQCRDLYITSPDGNYSLYIDKDGFVWVYDVTTNTYNKTENQLLPLDGHYQGSNPAYSYNINAVTGEVEYASYYNGKFGV